MRMNMSDFATFFAVARNQSFRAAGDELGKVRISRSFLPKLTR
ncbi:hypothetical protein FGAF1267_28880 [Escherichia coli]|nr:hypothetical protein FGAF637_28340 [Escherichia coli]CAK0721798.1 hypothetical protein FGAF1267_28880 [Escherichia coli]